MNVSLSNLCNMWYMLLCIDSDDSTRAIFLVFFHLKVLNTTCFHPETWESRGFTKVMQPKGETPWVFFWWKTIHPGEPTCPQKSDYLNRTYIFQPSFFRGYVSCQGGNKVVVLSPPSTLVKLPGDDPMVLCRGLHYYTPLGSTQIDEAASWIYFLKSRYCKC